MYYMYMYLFVKNAVHFKLAFTFLSDFIRLCLNLILLFTSQILFFFLLALDENYVKMHACTNYIMFSNKMLT